MAAAVSRFDRMRLCSGDLAQACTLRQEERHGPWMWTLACGRTPRSQGYATDAGGCDSGIRKELAPGGGKIDDCIQNSPLCRTRSLLRSRILLGRLVIHG